MISKVFFLTTLLLFSFCFTPIFGKQTTPLEILFIANTNALLENCHCGNPSLGGLARIATIVEKERQENPDLVFIDGGDFFNTYPFYELNHAVLDIYSFIQPDLLVLGENEFIEELPSKRSFFEKYLKNIICSNYMVDNLNAINYRQYDNIIFLSFLNEKVISDNIIDKIKFNNARFRSLYEKFKNQYLIVIYHGYSDSLKEFIDTYPNIKLVLSAHRSTNNIERYYETSIIGSGTDGEYVVKVNLDAQKKVKVKLIPVSLEIEQNEHVMKYINQFKQGENKRSSSESSNK